MTTTAGEPRSEISSPGPLGGWTAAAKHALDRPLTSYYLLLGASTLLVTIGLMMVLSASSIDGYEKHGSSYFWFFRQVTWMALALPVAFIVSRLPHRVIRGFAWWNRSIRSSKSSRPALDPR